MPTFTEEWVMSQWLYETLNVSSITTLAVGGVHRGFVPPATTTHPYISYDPATASDLHVMNTQPRVLSASEWDIRVIGTELQGETINKVSALINGLLNGKSATVSSGKIVSCRRLRSFTRPEDDEGITFLYNVSSFVIQAQAT